MEVLLMGYVDDYIWGAKFDLTKWEIHQYSVVWLRLQYYIALTTTSPCPFGGRAHLQICKKKRTKIVC